MYTCNLMPSVHVLRFRCIERLFYRVSNVYRTRTEYERPQHRLGNRKQVYRLSVFIGKKTNCFRGTKIAFRDIDDGQLIVSLQLFNYPASFSRDSTKSQTVHGR